MKRLFVLMSCALVLGGCSMFKRQAIPMAPEPVKTVEPSLVDANGTPIERVPFRTGVSSATVEKMAKARGCTGGLGAGLVTEPGPVEGYRMLCENGKTFKARCELRQCKAL